MAYVFSPHFLQIFPLLKGVLGYFFIFTSKIHEKITNLFLFCSSYDFTFNFKVSSFFQSWCVFSCSLHSRSFITFCGQGEAQHKVFCYECGSLFLQHDIMHHQRHCQVFHVPLTSSSLGSLISPLVFSLPLVA